MTFKFRKQYKRLLIKLIEMSLITSSKIGRDLGAPPITQLHPRLKNLIYQVLPQWAALSILTLPPAR